MKYLGTIDGIGRLTANSKDLCEAGYSIAVYDRGQFKYKVAHGTLRVDMSDLLEAFNAGATFAIKLQSGDEVSINITKLTGRGVAFNVTGPVPGF